MDAIGRERDVVAAELRLAYALPFSAFGNGAAIALAGILVYGLARGLLGPPLWIPGGEGGWGHLARDAQDVLVAVAAAGFIVGAMRYAVEGNERDVREAAKRGGFALPEERSHTSLVQPAALQSARLSGLAGAVAGLAVGAGTTPYPEAAGGLLWSGVALAALVGLGALLGRAIAFTVATTRELDRLARLPPSLDLLDPAPLYRFGRVGLRLSFTWVVGLTLFSFLTLFGATPGTVVVVAPVLGGIVAVAVLALVLPVRTLHARIRETKERELERLRAELRRAHHEGGEGAAGGRIADLCALEARIEAVREWPFEGGTLARFALYLLIPAGSWFAGAFVERLVSAALD